MIRHSRICVPLAVVSGLVSGLAAQGAALQDPAELMRLQNVLQAAMRGVAPSVVRVETFGGMRRVLAPDIAHTDGIAKPDKPPKIKWSGKDLEALFGKLDPDELAELWREAGLEPKADDEPFEARDLQKLGPKTLLKLFQKYRVGPFAPKDEKPKPPDEEEKKKNPLKGIVQPGFLQAQGATAGVVLTADGWILVSRFALNLDPSTILITLADGRTFTAQRGGQDTSRGLALVKIEAEGLPVPEFVDPETVRVGCWAFALGRTFGRGDLPSVHMGVVSATDRLFGRALQIDAYTSPANYGGPVIDVHGRVLGISVPLSPSGRDVGVDWYDSGIGFATSIGDIPALLDRMKEGETLERGWLGIGLEGKDFGPGALIANVADDSPALGIGIEKGDRIVSIDEVSVKNSFHLQMLLSSHMAGDPVHIGFQRGDAEPRRVTAFLAAVPLREREAQTRKEETHTLPWEGDPEKPEGK